MSSQHAVDDDDFTPPEAVYVDPHTRSKDCPTCRKPLKKHSSLQLLHCAEGEDPDDGQTVTVSNGEQPADYGEYDAWRAMQPPKAATIAALVATAAEVAEIPTPAITAEDVRNGALDLPNILPLPDGGLDYEALAAAMRVVIERERDEIVRRGGPLEKRNQELKIRLADALDEAALWRRRHNAAVEARNSLQAQLDEKTKEMRKLKGGKDRSGAAHASATSVKDILRVVEATKGFRVERKGNDHYGIYKEGVFITDMASSPGQERANMATRVKLRKAGAPV